MDEPKINQTKANATRQANLTPCVIVDYMEGKIQTCSSICQLRWLRNLFWTWQIDRNMVNKINKDYLQLGVCESHFSYDQNQLHNNKNKQTKQPELAIIQDIIVLDVNNVLQSIVMVMDV